MEINQPDVLAELTAVFARYEDALVNNRVEVLRPETGNAPNVFYVGIDKEVN